MKEYRIQQIWGEVTGKAKVYEGEDGEYYWHAKALNGDIIAYGGQGYTRENDAVHGLETAIKNMGGLIITVHDKGVD